MRCSSSLAIVLLLLLAVVHSPGQTSDVSMHATGPAHLDKRPFGKYLVEVCTLQTTNDGKRTVKCQNVPNDALPESLPLPSKYQSITLTLVCDPNSKAPCDLTNPKVGSDFFVSAKSSSGLPVRQIVLMGNISPLGGTNIIKYHVNMDGPIVLRAFAASVPPLYSAPAPVDLLLQPASASSSGDDGACAVMPTSAPGTVSMLLDAPTMVTLLGNPTPYILAAQGPNTIAIYTTREPSKPNENAILLSLQKAMKTLAVRTPDSLGITVSQATPFSVVLRIPHASALGDLASRLGTLNDSQFAVQDVGREFVRITATGNAPDCDAWKSYLSQIRAMVWQLVSQPMSKQLFYLSSSDVATGFSGLGSTAPASTSTPSAATTPTTTPPATTTAVSASPTSTATISIAQPPGSNVQIDSDTTPCVVVGLATGSSTGCGASTATSSTPSSSATPAATSNTAVAPTPLAMASVAVAAGTGEQAPPDLLVYADANPGDDAQIQERNRIIAELDLPRPEVILNAWVAQDSSASQETIGAFSSTVSEAIDNYDQQIESIVLDGWNSLKSQIASNKHFYNEPYRSYLADRFIADPTTDAPVGKTLPEMSQAFLDYGQVKFADPVLPVTRKQLGICERGKYCLGYTELFNPVKPALADMLLLIIAAQNPILAATTAVDSVQGEATPPEVAAPCTIPISGGPLKGKDLQRCEAIWKSVSETLIQSNFNQPQSCSERDVRATLASLAAGKPRVHLQCFLDEINRVLAPNGSPPFGIGLLRAAVADFLYNYKMSQQYPHEFSAYDLSHSADQLNASLSSIIDAFNRDLKAYQVFVRADVEYRIQILNRNTDGRCCVKKLFGLDKPSFFNDGLVSVRTIAGQQAQVDTASQSMLNVSTAPQLSAVLNSLAGGGGGVSSTSSTNGTTTSTGAAAGPMAPLAGAASVLSNYQTTYAQIGRLLNFTATPRSLATASSAEITVTLNADENASAPPTFMTGGTTNAGINFSRVANHDVQTRVRVESVKLFEVSSFSAIVESSRSRFPLLPPFVEIPYIGTFAGIPIGPAKEFHASSAIISAYVVPTAADIAYGLRFLPDLIVDGINPGTCSFFAGAAGPDVTQPCIFKQMYSIRDAGAVSLSQFNKKMIECFANDTSISGCESVKFENTPYTR